MKRHAAGALAVFLAAAPAGADVVTLQGGRVLEGKVVEAGDTLRIDMLHGSTVVDRADVVRIDPAPTVQDLYAERAAKVAEGDAPGRFALALWCRSKGWDAQAEVEAERVLAVEPDHAGARRLLGYERYNGQWMRADDVRHALGLVRHQGQWTTPEMAKALMAQESQARAAKERRENWKVQTELFDRARRKTYEAALQSQYINTLDLRNGQARARGGSFEAAFDFGDGVSFRVRAEAGGRESLSKWRGDTWAAPAVAWRTPETAVPPPGAPPSPPEAQPPPPGVPQPPSSDPPDRTHGNNGVGNGLDPQPPGNPPVNDGPGTGPGNPGNRHRR